MPIKVNDFQALLLAATMVRKRLHHSECGGGGSYNLSFSLYAGRLPCHVFLTATDRNTESYVNWLAGFLTASNAIFSGTKNITPELCECEQIPFTCVEAM